jgi:hypothetical protein
LVRIGTGCLWDQILSLASGIALGQVLPFPPNEDL